MTSPPRVYADTSVFGGPFDTEFAEPSKAFFEQVSWGRFELVVSALVRREVASAPKDVRDLFEQMVGIAEVVEPSIDSLELRRAYLEAKILTPRSADDALHVAMATVARCGVIVSWNFQHIVHFQKIPLYNAVNTLKGFTSLSIYSPQQVIDYEEKF